MSIAVTIVIKSIAIVTYQEASHYNCGQLLLLLLLSDDTFQLTQ